jgi:hypothetical protein
MDQGGGPMDTFRGRSFFLLVCGLALVCIVLGLLILLPVRADVGIQPILPDGSNIQPDVETPIQMTAERVVFNVRQATEWDSATIAYNPTAYGLQNPQIPIWSLSVAEVSAVFTMTNPTSQELRLIVWFPLASSLESDEWESHPGEVAPRIEKFLVAVDEQPITYDISELPNPKGTEFPLLLWASFPVTFPAGQDVLIHVSYLIWAQEDIVGVGMVFSYILQTGAGWDGPIGHAELIFNLPYIASPETISVMPEGGQIEGYQARWTWENFEPGPGDDFSIWLIRQERWEDLESARIRVSNWPDGESWLDLADTYRRLILGKYQFTRGFREAYQPLGVQAAQEALRLLPRDGRPHYEMAIFYLAALPENPTIEDLEPLLDELRIVVELAPSYEGEIRDWMEFILSSEQWESLTEIWATETEAAASLQTPLATPSQIFSSTSTPVPSVTSQPYFSTTPAQTEPIESITPSEILIVVGAVLGICILGYLVLKRTRGSASK